MCEQCMPVSTGLMSYRYAIRQCPRLANLGPATVAWLTRAIIDEVEEAIEIENEGDNRGMTARAELASRPLRIVLAAALITVLAVGLVGVVRAHVLWEWWRASPTDIMLASALLTELIITAILIRLLPRNRPSDVR